MQKTIIILALTILTGLVFRLFQMPGTQAILDLSNVVVGIIYLGTGIGFFRKKEKRALYFFLGFVLLIASAFAILPLLFYFLNAITFVININYNDILFNYYKYLLNALIGLALFISVCAADMLLQLREANTDAEKKKYKILLGIAGILAVVVSIAIIRNLGYHLSWSKIVIKIALLCAVLIVLPYLLYTGYFKNKLFALLFLSSVFIFMASIQPKYLFSFDFSGTKWLVYNNPIRQVSGPGVDTLKTINSLRKEGANFYSITFSGDYTAVLESNNKKCVEESFRPQRFCSLFTSFGDTSHYLFARNFDNPQGWKCKTLICRTDPEDGYASLSLVRLADMGYDVSEDLENLSYDRKKGLVNAVFFTPDGINEKGVVVALAAVDPQRLKGDSSKPFINCSYLIREILDHAKDVEEAKAIIKKYNIMNDVWSGSFDQHLLIADASGKSVIAEISDGEFQFIPNTANWQATTNSPSYRVPMAEQKKNCTRFNAISYTMEAAKGNMTTNDAMQLLQQIGHQYTEWSAVYDISARGMTVVIDFDFTKKYRFSIKKDNAKQY
ncbi:MAG: hypothetical protein K0S33_2129 [Bacteroidetes bacterium]|jgi:hypothetical protein|nr:hypothetical protein [Bacteroidota bacterium]